VALLPPTLARMGQIPASFLAFVVRGSETSFAFCNAPLLTSFGRTPASGRRAPRNGGLLRCPISRLGVQITDNVCVLQRAPFSLRSAGPPRLTPRPPEGGCYAARIHAWVRFLLPRTNLAMNAEHRSRESA